MSYIYTKPNSTTGQNIYPDAKINAVDYVVKEFLEVTAELAHNPIKVALRAYGEIGNADLIWLVNGIKNPFKELRVGTILTIPALQQASSMIRRSASQQGPKTIKVKNVKVNGQKISY